MKIYCLKYRYSELKQSRIEYPCPYKTNGDTK